MPTEISDGLELHKSGNITAIIEMKRYELRKPKTGEFKRLREDLEDINDDIFEKTLDSKVTTDALDALDEDAEGPETREKIEKRIELQLEARKLNRDLRTEIEDRRNAWMRQVFELLSKTPLEIEDDDLPVWFNQADTVTSLIEHWQTNPPARGVR